MSSADKRLRTAYVLLVLNLAVIWGNYLLPGEISGAISGFVRDLIAAILPGDSGGPDAGHGLLRKLGHFTEFACLGAILCRIMKLRDRPWLFALGLGFLAACVDETIQIFVPDRGPAFTDVLIDTSGVLCGIFLLLAAVRLAQKSNIKNQ